MRVLVVASERPPVVSGVANSVQSVVSGLETRGHTVDVLAAVDFPRVIAGEFRFAGLAQRWATVAPKLPSYDVVNLHGPAPTISDAVLALMRSLPASLRPPVVYTHHSNIEVNGLRYLSGRYNVLHEKLTRLADHVVVTSSAYATQIAQASTTPVTVVPWGVDVSRFHDTSSYDVTEQRPLQLVFIGQMRPYKGLSELICAVAGRPELELQVVGSGPLLEQYRAEAGTSSNITFRGRVSEAELVEVYAASDAVVLPSTTTAEAFGLVLLEGMAAGCVPIASDLPGVRDLAGPTGVVVPPSDVVALRDALLSLAADRPRLVDAKVRSRTRSEQFSVESVAHRYEQILTDVVTGWRGTRAVTEMPPGWEDPEARLEEIGARFGAESVALLLFDNTSEHNLRAHWSVGPAYPDDSGTPDLAPRLTANRQATLISPDPRAPSTVTLWPQDAGSSEIHLPFSRSRSATAVLGLRRADRVWRYSDVPLIYRALGRNQQTPAA